jgi:hypothetical protein
LRDRANIGNASQAVGRATPAGLKSSPSRTTPKSRSKFNNFRGARAITDAAGIAVAQ